MSASTGNDHLQKEVTLLPGSPGEHALQAKYGSGTRARSFYSREVLTFLSPLMCDFISRQEFLFISTSDAQGRCDCSPRFGEPGFIQVLDDRHVLYPEYRGNGVFASLGNISENPQMGLLIIDFYRDQIGLHINGCARIVEEPNRSVIVEVQEAYVHCSKHIPKLQKMERKIDWGTDSRAAKKADYFQLQGISLYDRLGGERAVKVVVDNLLLKLELAGFMVTGAHLASFVAAAFGGTNFEVQTLPLDLNRFAAIFRQTLEELGISAEEVDKMMEPVLFAKIDPAPVTFPLEASIPE